MKIFAGMCHKSGQQKLMVLVQYDSIFPKGLLYSLNAAVSMLQWHDLSRPVRIKIKKLPVLSPAAPFFAPARLFGMD